MLGIVARKDTELHKFFPLLLIAQRNFIFLLLGYRIQRNNAQNELWLPSCWLVFKIPEVAIQTMGREKSAKVLLSYSPCMPPNNSLRKRVLTYTIVTPTDF